MITTLSPVVAARPRPAFHHSASLDNVSPCRLPGKSGVLNAGMQIFGSSSTVSQSRQSLQVLSSTLPTRQHDPLLFQSHGGDPGDGSRCHHRHMLPAKGLRQWCDLLPLPFSAAATEQGVRASLV